MKSWECWSSAKGRQVFQAKSEFVEATPERLDALRRFRQDLDRSSFGSLTMCQALTLCAL